MSSKLKFYIYLEKLGIEIYQRKLYLLGLTGILLTSSFSAFIKNIKSVSSISFFIFLIQKIKGRKRSYFEQKNFRTQGHQRERYMLITGAYAFQYFSRTLNNCSNVFNVLYRNLKYYRQKNGKDRNITKLININHINLKILTAKQLSSDDQRLN